MSRTTSRHFYQHVNCDLERLLVNGLGLDLGIVGWGAGAEGARSCDLMPGVHCYVLLRVGWQVSVINTFL